MITLFAILIVIVAADFILERLLAFLNYRSISASPPSELAGVYEGDEYRRSQEYSRANSRFGLLTSSCSFALLLGLLCFGGFGLVDGWSRALGLGEIGTALVFFAILFLAADIITLPFSLYATFVIEARFGFNKTTLPLFAADKVKGWLLTMVIGGTIMGLVLWFIELAGPSFWLWAWLLLSAFAIFMAMFYSSLIVPLFNKQTPLADGELRQAIEAFAGAQGFRLDNIFVIDGSKRSTKANAYFSGLGPKKRIVLYDTLINDLEVEELVAVLAHEVGHYQRRHIIKGLGLGLMESGLMLYVFSLCLAYPQLSEVLGAGQPGVHLAMITFAILYSPLSTVSGLAMNSLSRRNEYEADRYAMDHYGAPPLAQGLRKLARNNLSNLTPHPAYVFFNYSHPPLLARLRRLQG
ncbi:MAG: M48 family metallopeptidase [Thermodesulfobacteriota bacterium]